MPFAAVVVAVNAGEVAVEANVLGPLQLYVGEPVPLTPTALKVAPVPTHSAFGEALILVMVGKAFTVTVDVDEFALVQPVPG